MEKKLLIALLLLTSVLLMSCENENYFKIGTSWVDSNLKLVYIDSCSAKLSTVRIDSVPTYNQGAIMVGKYVDLNTITGDTLTGTVKALSYLEVSNLYVPTDLGNNVFFDSLVIEMRFNGFYMGDTLSDMHLFVHQLTERIQQDVDVGTEAYYNTTSFAYNPTPLVEAIFPIRPSNMESGKTNAFGIPIDPVRIKLPDEMGEDLFEKIKNKDEIFDTNDKFQDYFKGLVFVAGDDVETLAGFRADSTFKVNLHYHIQEEFKTDKIISTTINSQNQFNNIHTDRTGTKLLPDLFFENEIDSHLTGNQSYIAAGDGLYTKIEFPSLKSILLLSDYGIVEKATMEIIPVFGTYQEYTPLPSSLAIASTNLSGSSQSLADSQGQSQSGSLVFDPQFWDNTRYIFDVTAFVQNQMTAPIDNQLFLTVRFSDTEMRGTAQRLVIGNNAHSIDVGNRTYYNRIKLNLYYNMYND
jgi:hypothetical protein